MEKVIKRYFTKGLDPWQSVFDMFNWKTVDVEIKNESTGEIMFKMENCVFPEHYSQTACEIIASKYFYRGIPETGLDQVVTRMVHFWLHQLEEEGLIKNNEDYSILFDELAYSLLNQMWAPNSPQWFNTGLRASGVLGGSDDLFYYDEKAEEVVKSEDRYTRTQASACFILDIKDQLLGPGSISDHYVNETKLFKGGSGVGTNFSALRAAGEHLSSGGTSSGLMSYLEGLDRNAGAIKSGGTTRRAAKMVIVDIDHPEIMDFIRWKAHEEKKAKALIRAGYDGSIGGEAYNTVSGQNSNNSVRVNAKFMRKVLNGKKNAKIKLKGRVDESVNRKVKVSELWDAIAQAAWECGDPAVQFDDTFNEWNTCANSGRINATNPCSEYAFLDNTACNLASINVFKFWDTENEIFDDYGFKHLVGIIQLVLEASIAGGQFPTPEVAENSYKFRPTGLGLTNLAPLFLALDIPYDSEDARAVAAALCSLMTGWSYVVSAGIAREIGPFEEWEENKEAMKRVIYKHSSYAEDCSSPAVSRLGNVFWQQELAWSYAKTAVDYGYRNAQVSVMAPTGTISLAMDCASTGIEPFYSHTLYKKCSDGSFMTIDNPLIKSYIHSVSGCESTEDSIKQYFKNNGTYQGCPDLTEEQQAVLATAMEISPEGHVKMVAGIQPYISGSVSKTVNLPHDATPDDIKRIYEMAYELGCKSIAVYRDGSKGVQPLNDKETEEEPEDFEESSDVEIESKLSKTDDELESSRYKVMDTEMLRNAVREWKEENYYPRKPEGIRNSRTHSAKIGDVELYITVGYYPDGKMAELFVSTDRDGTVVKGLLTCLSKAVSHLLQNHVEPQEISKMLRGQKFEPSGPVSRHPNIKFAESIADLISKVIDIECGDYTRCQVKPEENYDLYVGDTLLPKKPPEFTLSDKPATFSFNAEIDGGVNKLLKDLKDSLENSLDNAVSKTEESATKSGSKNLSDDIERIYGERCPECGSDRLIKSGTCKTCQICGATTGCA